MTFIHRRTVLGLAAAVAVPSLAAAVPQLSEWEWGVLSHVMSGIEGHRILSGDDGLPAPSAIAAEIDTWADGAQDDDCLRAGKLRERVMAWAPLTVAGVLMRLRRAGGVGIDI